MVFRGSVSGISRNFVYTDGLAAHTRCHSHFLQTLVPVVDQISSKRGRYALQLAIVACTERLVPVSSWNMLLREGFGSRRSATTLADEYTETEILPNPEYIHYNSIA